MAENPATNLVCLYGYAHWQRAKIDTWRFLRDNLIFGVAIAVLSALVGYFTAPYWAEESKKAMSTVLWPLIFALSAFVLFGVVVFLFNLCAAPFRIYHDDQNEIAVLKKERLEIEQTKPRIKVKRTFVDYRPMMDRENRQVIAQLFFAHAMFINDPVHAVPNAIAKDIVTMITYYTKTGKEVASVIGRWGDSPQPTDPFDPTINLPPIELKIGQQRELNLAMKYPEDDSCYGFHNGSYFQPEWRDPSLRLSEEEYEVKVSLRGPWVDEIYVFLLKNLGKGKGLEIQGKRS